MASDGFLLGSKERSCPQNRGSHKFKSKLLLGFNLCPRAEALSLVLSHLSIPMPCTSTVTPNSELQTQRETKGHNFHACLRAEASLEDSSRSPSSGTLSSAQGLWSHLTRG